MADQTAPARDNQNFINFILRGPYAAPLPDVSRCIQIVHSAPHQRQLMALHAVSNRLDIPQPCKAAYRRDWGVEALSPHLPGNRPTDAARLSAVVM
jgi:hypothetical protein